MDNTKNYSAYKKIVTPQDQVFWYLKRSACKQLRQDLKADVVIIGGGMAGITAAQSFHQKGYSVVLLEKYYCGAGATGKSSGFITPAAELGLEYFVKQFGQNNAKILWNFVTGGVDVIRNNIAQYHIDCDYQIQDTLVLANTEKSTRLVHDEYNTRKTLSYDSLLYTKDTLATVIGSTDYYAGVRYGNTFGISAYIYCQEMKNILQKVGVHIFEETPVIAIDHHGVQTPYAHINAERIIVCTDRFTPDLQKALYNKIYHAQTFLIMSAPLSDADVKKIFPEKPCMVWDTDLIYQYFRLTGDNRLMIGGGDIISTFWPREKYHYTRMFKKLTRYIQYKFPDVPIHFEQMWPGLLGISKDIMPIAGILKDQPNIFYISCATGLPWAAALGNYSSQDNIDTTLDHYFSPERKFPIDGVIQTIMGKVPSFALSNLITMMNQ